MATHVAGESCPGCEVKLSQTRPELATWYREKVKPQFPDSHISWSFRDREYQDEAVKEGKSHLPWPKSRHNLMKDGKPWASALDLFRLVEGKALFPVEWFHQIYEAFENGPEPIRWGGKFKSLGDFDHFEWLG